jgi:hypothetical protein
MIVSIPCSFGELIDKLTILEIKRERIQASEARQLIELEWHQLNASLNELLPLLKDSGWLAPLRQQLLTTNMRLWDLEETVRRLEKHQDFGSAFVTSARAIYAGNDERARIKRAINTQSGSTLVEVKSHSLGAQRM